MSSLAKQLNSLRKDDQVLTHMASKLHSSLLFDMKEAGKVTLEKVRELAIEGYHNLMQVNPQVAAHRDIIFEQNRVDRMKLTPSEHSKLSEELKELLLVLS